VSELADFSVRAAKDLGVSASKVGEAALQAAALSGDAPYSLFLFGMPMQAVQNEAGDGADILAFHNGFSEALKSQLCIRASLGESASPVPGWPHQHTVWQLRGKHLLHPDQFHQDQPLLAQWSEAIEVLEGALRGRLDFPAFKSRLDRIGLPVDWRNHLVNEVFKQAEGAKPSPGATLGFSANQAGADDPLAALLDQVAIPGESPRPSAAQAFIQAVGSDSTGFVLDKEAASALLTAFQVFRKQVQSQAEKAGLDVLFGYGAALAALVKKVRGRARQVGWLVPPSARPDLLAHGLSQHQGPVEVLALAGFANWQEAMSSAYAVLAQKAKVILVQAEPDTYADLLEGAKASPFADKTYLMMGKVRCAFGNDFCALKPATLAYVEAALAAQRAPLQCVEEPLVLEDQDPCPGRSERHVAEKIWSESEWAEACRKGENWLNGKLGSASILFRPLVAAKAAR
jgi:hypothetical protein